MDKKTYYGKDVNTPQIDLQIPYQNPTWFSCRNGQADARINMKIQRIQNRQDNLEKEKQKVEDSHFPFKKTYYKIAIIKSG